MKFWATSTFVINNNYNYGNNDMQSIAVETLLLRSANTSHHIVIMCGEPVKLGNCSRQGQWIADTEPYSKSSAYQYLAWEVPGDFSYSQGKRVKY